MTWRPESEADIRALVDSGDANESHVVDFKREVGTSERDRNEIGADMASFAIDGGSLVVGVDETEKDRFTTKPIPIAGVVERIEQIATNRIRPPLDVRPRVIPSEADPALGYVVIDVPVSPSRPHMVGGRYYGRGEKTRRHLDDAEVVRLLAARRDAEQPAREALYEERAREPNVRPLGRMFGVAEPLQAPPGAGRDLVRGATGPMMEITDEAEQVVPSTIRQWSPNMADLFHGLRRSKGLARTNLGEGRQGDPQHPDYGADFEVQASGSVRVMASRIVEARATPRIEGEVHVIFDQVVVAWVYRLIGGACATAPRIGYRGSWSFGIHVYGLEGGRAYDNAIGLYSLPIYNDATFEAVTTATLAELEDNPHAIVERLVGDLVHGLGTRNTYPDMYPPEQPA